MTANPGRREFPLRQGTGAHIILADEINRTPPKTQAALLQARQEYHVTVGGQFRLVQRQDIGDMNLLRHEPATDITELESLHVP